MLDEHKSSARDEDVLAAPFSPQAVAVTGLTVLALSVVAGRVSRGVDLQPVSLRL